MKPGTRNEISMHRDSIGVRRMPDGLDSGGCHICRRVSEAVVRVNLGGIWTSLCVEHRDLLRQQLDRPMPAPKVQPCRA